MFLMCKKFNRTPAQYLEQDSGIIELFFDFIQIEEEEEKLKRLREDQTRSIS